jgi:hypothetical protein
MNYLKLFPLTRNQKILFFLIITTVVVVLFYIFSKIPQGESPIYTNTIPVIPTKTKRTEAEAVTLDPVRILNPEQKTIFNWGSVTTNIPESMGIYSIDVPIINTGTISSLIGKLGFSKQDQLTDLPEGDLQFINSANSLFVSTNTNQISYFTSLDIPPHNLNIPTSEAIVTAKKIISDLFGESFVLTLDKNPETRYFIHNPTSVEVEPKEATMESANVIAISFKQIISNFPIVSLSQKGGVVSVAIDTTNKLYSMIVNGGYQKVTEIKKDPLISFSNLMENATQQSLRISQSKDMNSERSFTDAKQINVTVKSVDLGYFQLNNDTLSPIYIINGIMSAKGLVEYPAIYIVPATK